MQKYIRSQDVAEKWQIIVTYLCFQAEVSF